MMDRAAFGKRRSKTASRLFVLFVLVADAAPAFAGAWDGAVLGPRASTMATAFVGLADDPSAVFYNPAGLALLERDEGLSIAARYNASTLTYEFPEGRHSPEGKSRGESDLSGILPDLFYYRKFGPVAAGLGAYVPYGGLAGAWDKDIFGVAMNQFMAVGSITPSLSWAITPRLSVGAGFNAYLGYMQSDVTMSQIPIAMFDPILPPNVQGLIDRLNLTYIPLKLDQKFHAFGPGFGFNAGVLFRPVDSLSVGVCLRSGADVKLDGPANIRVHLPNGDSLEADSDLTIRYKLPYLVTAGLALRPIEGLVLTGDVQYAMWSRLDAIRLTFEKLDFTQVNPTGFKDVITFMVGGEYTFFGRYSARLGYKRFPSNIEDDELLSYQSWDTTMNTFSFGLGYLAWENFSIHAIGMVSVGDWNVKHADDPTDPIGKPAGKYTTFFQTYGLGCLWYF